MYGKISHVFNIGLKTNNIFIFKSLKDTGNLRKEFKMSPKFICLAVPLLLFSPLEQCD